MVNLAYCVYKRGSIVPSKFALTVMLVLACQLLTTAKGYTLYVSKADGNDKNGTNTCRNITSPCQTLGYVIKRATENDVIMMYAKDTEKAPYNSCPTEVITKNLRFNALEGTAVINCSGNGLQFEGNSTTVTFHSLKFLDTFLKVSDSSLIVNNCSFSSENAAFLYIIEAKVGKVPSDLAISILSSTFLDNNTAGALNMVNNQKIAVSLNINNMKINNNYLEKANYAISIQGYVNFNLINSVISGTKFAGDISKPTLIYFDGCLDAEKSLELSKNYSNVTTNSDGADFQDVSGIITYNLNVVNFSLNQAGILQTLFCTGAQMNITDTAVLNNKNNKETSGGAIVVNTTYRDGATLGVVITNSHFVQNVNKEIQPIVFILSSNLTLSVMGCNFSHNNGGAVHVRTTRDSKLFFGSCRIHCNSATNFAFTHCGSQICVIFRNQDDFGTGLHRPVQTNAVLMEKGIRVPPETRYSGGWNMKRQRDGSLETRMGGPLRTNNDIPNSQSVNRETKGCNSTLNCEKGATLEPKATIRMETNASLSSKREISSSPLMNGETMSLDPGLLVEDCEFYNNTGRVISSGALEVRSELSTSLSATVQVSRCVFENNVAHFGTGGVYASINIKLNIYDSTFRNNAGLDSGAIYFPGTTMLIHNCTLDSNSGGSSAFSQARGSVRLINHGTAWIRDSRIIQRKVEDKIVDMGSYHANIGVSSYGFNAIFLSNTVLEFKWSPSLEKVIVLEVAHTPRFVTETNTSINCPRGYQIKHHMLKESEQSFECNLCSLGSYSIERGVYKNNKSNDVKCLLCPYGGMCTKGLEALPNFWGYKIQERPPTVEFSRCPSGYCCQAEKGCVAYDKCNSGRRGRLCGECMPGFTETLFTPSCRQSEKCNDYWFWPTAVIFVLVFSLYLIVQPDITAILYRSITWFRSTPPQVPDSEPASDAGLERIVFFYYQAIDILSVQSSNDSIWYDHLTQFTLGLFNFDVRLDREGFACPFPGLSPVTKLLFHTLGVFSVLFAIPFIFLLHKAISTCFPNRSPRNGIYLAAFLKSVFLGYTVLARKSLTLLQCVSVDGVNCLFLNCNIECYTWWQTLIGTLVLVFFLPFVLVLFFGSAKLYNKRISVLHFFLACLFPLPFLSYWFLNRQSLRERLVPDTSGRTAITSVLIGSYRVPDHVSAGAIYWESVLIGRMFVLIIPVLIKDPFLRSLAFLLLCIVNLSLHIHIQPFERSLDNRAETISLFCLVLTAMFNLPFMAYYSKGLSPAGPMSKVINVFSWCQVVLVGFLPFICVLLVFIALVSQAVRLMCFLTRGIRLACCSLACSPCFGRNRRELDDPLIG